MGTPLAKSKPPQRRRNRKVELHVGLGDAIRRLILLDQRYKMGLDAEGVYAVERDLLYNALNMIPIDLPVKCFPDEMPQDLGGDGVLSFFEAAATTSCCRIVKKDTSRVPEPPQKKAPVRYRGAGR